MAAKDKKRITNRLLSLEELDDVSVTVSAKGGTIHVQHDKQHGLEFHFDWQADHFTGYFIDGNKNKSQAVVSLYTSLDAIHFVSAYAALNDIRAHQKQS